MARYFIDNGGAILGEVLTENPLNPDNHEIVSADSLPAPQEYCKWDGKKFVATLGWESEVLSKAKLTKREEINRARNTKEASGFPYLGKVFDSDQVSVQRITVAAQAAQLAKTAGQPFDIVWTAQDNTQVPLNVDQVIAMPVAIAEYANGLHVTAASLKAQVESASTVSAVEAIRWPE